MSPHPVPSAGRDRFRVSKRILRMDRFVRRFIIVGGIAVIAAVFGICLFIFAELVPLFQKPSVEPQKIISTAVEEPLFIGADEWTERPFVLAANGVITWVNVEEASIETEALPIPEDFLISAWDYHQSDQQILLGSDDGRAAFISINYRPLFAESGERTIVAEVEAEKAVIVADNPIIEVAFSTGESRRTMGYISEERATAARHLTLVSFVRERTLFGVGDFTKEKTIDLTASLPGEPKTILIGGGGQTLVVGLADSRIVYYRKVRGEWILSQEFRPFPFPAETASMDFLQGEVSINLTSGEGENAIFSLTPTEASGLQFVQTKWLADLASGATLFNASVRNKAYLLSDGETFSLRYATTEDVRWSRPLESPLVDALIGEKYDRILSLDEASVLEIFTLRDPHPEAGLKAFFGKIWYEGQQEPKYSWQSTGGTDDFEPKLSLMPLVLGSLKGTAYALLFAVPIALLAAIYTSQFLRPSLKNIVKPMMEIMASLPSVVLGFLGALWLAPILDTRVPSLILMVSSVTATAVIVGYIWNTLPSNVRVYLRPGFEFLVFVPLVVIVGWIGWSLGPILEGLVFRVTDPVTGIESADFRLWWSQLTGSNYQQRNALIVGIMMGFAVIPIIFTIAEDALSNVPRNMVSASLALGASRWQTTAWVVLPGAAGGIFSALIVGLGRAVGETMIVVMATGNTPIMDFDLFTGMRTLSANIAVELPEAPHGGTLYRTLFLGAFVLFVLTFFVNTIAEYLRQKLRTRYASEG